MTRVWSHRLREAVGQRVELAGWLHHQRRLAQVSFVLGRDARGISQVVVEEAELRAELASWPPETVLRVEGEMVAVPQAPGGVELHDPHFSLLTRPAGALPFELRRPQLEIQLPTLLDHAALSWRHPHHRALAPQFYKQTMVGVYERVYATAPVFRAEPHDPARHLAEYFSRDAEMGFVTDHRDVVALLREVLAAIFAAVAERAAEAVEVLALRLPKVPSEIPSIHFQDAQELIERATGEPVAGETDLAPSHERLLGAWAEREFQSELLFVVGYPMVKRPFYTHPDPERPEFSNSFDLLFRGLELVTGGQRLHLYRDYLTALEGQDLAPFQGYLQAFRYGMPPHGGFAIGLERLVARLAGMPNVRQVTLFPRDLHRLEP